MRIDVRGVILSAPEATVYRWICEPDEYCVSDEMVSALRDTQDETLDICIESPGGDILAAFAIINAVSDYALAHPKAEINCYVGGLAASAAASIVAMLPRSRCKVYAHRNSMFMFHGVYTTVRDAGAQAMQDQADLLVKLNGQIQGALLARTTIPPTTISQWFNEGRQGWIDGLQAVTYGLADQILELEAETLNFSDKFANKLKEQNIMDLTSIKNFIANLTKKNEEKPEEEGTPAENPPAEPEKKPEGGCGAEPEKNPEGEETPAENPPAEPEKKPEDDPELENHIHKLMDLCSDLKAQLANETTARKTAEAKLAKLTGGLKNTASAAAPTANTFQEAVKATMQANPGMTYNDAFCMTIKSHPALYDKLMSSKTF